MSVIWTKKAGLITLPVLSNPGTSSDLIIGKELIDEMGNVVIGSREENNIKTCNLSITFEHYPGDPTRSGYYVVNVLKNGVLTYVKEVVTDPKTVNISNVVCGSILSVLHLNKQCGFGTVKKLEMVYGSENGESMYVTANEGETATLSGTSMYIL